MQTKYIQYITFLAYIITTILICLIMLVLGFILGDRSRGDAKHLPFESGIQPIGSTKLRFNIKFYLNIIFFIIFDIETMYLYLWSSCIRETGWISFFEIILFIFILLLGLIYIIKVQKLNNVPKNSNNVV